MGTDNAADRVERLIRATPELVGELHLNVALQRIADLTRDLLGAQYAAVGLLGPDNRTLRSFTTAGMSEADYRRIGSHPTGRGILGLVIREGQVVRLSDLGAHPASVGFPAHHPPMKSFLGVPIIGRSGILGDLYLTEKIGAASFSDEDAHLAMLLATIVASAVENVQYHERTTQLLEEVQQLHRSRERFFAMVNHELRNALAAVYGWAEIMIRKKDPQTVPRGAYEILEAAEQATALVNDLLDLNRLDEDRLKPVIRDVDCHNLVQAAIQRCTPIAAEKSITLEGPQGGNRVVCRTDSHRIEQIFVNLFSNGIRHAPPGSTIHIGIEERPPFIEFRVSDEGPGIMPDMVDRIFDIYYTTAPFEGGTGHGVGLALSRRLARLLGGDLVAIPQPGGLFVLTVPAS